MKVFADTNFLVSAFATRGLSADVFQLVLAGHQLMTGDNDLLDISKQVPQLKIVTPREFWELVQK